MERKTEQRRYFPRLVILKIRLTTDEFNEYLKYSNTNGFIPELNVIRTTFDVGIIDMVECDGAKNPGHNSLHQSHSPKDWRMHFCCQYNSGICSATNKRCGYGIVNFIQLRKSR